MDREILEILLFGVFVFGSIGLVYYCLWIQREELKSRPPQTPYKSESAKKAPEKEAPVKDYDKAIRAIIYRYLHRDP